MGKNKDDDEVPEGAAFFPTIPVELGVSPFFLGVLHAIVFVGGSTDKIVNSAAGDEALGAIAGYLERLDGNDRRRALEDLAVLRGYAREQGWPKQLTAFLKSFPGEFGLEASE